MIFDRQAKMAFIILCISLLVCGVGFRAAVKYLNISLQKQPVELREHFATIPRAVGHWKAVGDDVVLDNATVDTLGTTLYLDRTYTRKDSEDQLVVLQVHLAYYTGMIDAVPHVPDRCMEAHGMDQQSLPVNLPLDIDQSNWIRDPNLIHRKSGEPYPTAMYSHHVTGKPIRVRLPLGEVKLRTTLFGIPGDPDGRIYAGYFFIANGITTPNPWGVKRLSFDPRDKYAYYCKMQFTMSGGQELTQEKFRDAVRDATEVLLPRVMACLPDWPSVERLTEDSSEESTQVSPDANEIDP